MPGMRLEAREQLVEVLRRARHDFADERLFARDGMDFADFRHLAKRVGELVVSAVRSRVTADERDQFEAEALGRRAARCSRGCGRAARAA